MCIVFPHLEFSLRMQARAGETTQQVRMLDIMPHGLSLVSRIFMVEGEN